MNTTPRLCVELSGCIANNLGFMRIPTFVPTNVTTLPVVAAIEALAWLNGPFAYAGEVHVTVKSEDSEFYEQAMQWLQSEHFFLRTGLSDENIHCYETVDELAKLASGLRPTIAVCAHIEPLLEFLLADTQILLDPHDALSHEYREAHQNIRGSRIVRVASWHEIMRSCTDSLSNTTPT